MIWYLTESTATVPTQSATESKHEGMYIHVHTYVATSDAPI